MKKMLAACAAMMVAGLVSADITSDNIVGYTQKTATAGFNWYTPMFTGVGLNTIDIQDIVLSGDKVGWGSENIQILDEGGATVTSYFYYDSGMTGLDKTCWVDDDFAAVSFAIAAGDGVLIDTGDDGEGVACTAAGEVPTADVTFTTVAGFNFTGNPFPATIDIQDITITDDAGAVGWGSENIQILDAGGATTTSFFYYDPGMTGLDTICWVDDDFAAVSYAFAAGDGFLIDTGDDGAGYTVTIKAPYTLE